MIIAQAAGEYGGLSGIGAGLGQLLDDVVAAMHQPKIAIPVIALAVVVLYLFLRRR